MTELSAEEQEKRRAALEYYSRLAGGWDYESWEAEHLRDKAGQFSWMKPREAAVEDSDRETELRARTLTRLGNRRSRFPSRVVVR